MTEYTGIIPGGGFAIVAPANPTRRRIKYQNQGVALMMFSATDNSDASSINGLAVPANVYQIYEWPQQNWFYLGQAADQTGKTFPDFGCPQGQITVSGTSGDQYYVEEA